MRVRFAPSPTGALHIGGARTALYNWLLAHGRGRPATPLVPGRSCCGSKIPTASARRRRTSSRSSTPCAGSTSTGTRGRSCRPSGPTATPRRSQQLLDVRPRLPLQRDRRRRPRLQGARTAPTAASAVSAEAAGRGAPARPRRRRDRRRRRHPRRRRASPTPTWTIRVIARADGSRALQLRGRGRRPRCRHHPRRARRGPPLQHAQAAARAPRRSARRPPLYAHLPLLHGPDGKKLSKRHGAASVQELRDAGYLPEAVDNYIALLGAGFAADEEFFTPAELAERFRLERVSKNPAVFDEQKLRHINGQHLRELAPSELTAPPGGSSPAAPACAARSRSPREKIQTLADFWPLVGFLFDGPVDDAGGVCEDDRSRGRGRGAARRARGAGRSRAVRRRGRSRRRCARSSSSRGVKPGKVFQPVRVAIAGPRSPPASSSAWRCSAARRSLRPDRRCAGAR